ncbi:Hypothetical protein, putative [Bodo saltans]|uniref:Membrane-associated protein n=1 Tax=Bodo saltans TaxID=75058 RepID=A0A0S4IL88_BODSA|nr:Hypothetical protein, putative [Bodo saltans]|eukprot:CUF22679.1 Hypothetical protein, putative [Bodo saltans]
MHAMQRSAKALLLIVCCVLHDQIVAQTCGQCPASECDAGSRRCPTTPDPYLCLSGAAVGGCSSTAWETGGSAACSSCCDERTCYQNDCSVACNATTGCTTAHCTVASVPYYCYAGTSVGQCGATVGVFENPPYGDDCRGCCDLSLCGATTLAPPTTVEPTVATTTTAPITTMTTAAPTTTSTTEAPTTTTPTTDAPTTTTTTTTTATTMTTTSTTTTAAPTTTSGAPTATRQQARPRLQQLPQQEHRQPQRQRRPQQQPQRKSQQRQR